MENSLMGDKIDDEDGGQEDLEEANEEDKGEDYNNKGGSRENMICVIGCCIHKDDFDLHHGYDGASVVSTSGEEEGGNGGEVWE